MIIPRGTRTQLRDAIRSVSERKQTTQMEIATVGEIVYNAPIGFIDALSLATAGLCHEVGGWTIDFVAIVSGGYIWPE